MKNIEDRLFTIEQRNKRVETDKAWETSASRKIIIGILTYVVVVIFFYSMNLSKPFTNAIVPTLGFLISTLTLSFFKSFWVRRKLRK